MIPRAAASLSESAYWRVRSPSALSCLPRPFVTQNAALLNHAQRSLTTVNQERRPCASSLYQARKSSASAASPRPIRARRAAAAVTASAGWTASFVPSATARSVKVEKFKQLVQAIKESLADVKVFLLGKGPERDVYVVGRSEAGWAGLKTRVTET